jgi:Fe2+ transport system protein FeoA
MDAMHNPHDHFASDASARPLTEIVEGRTVVVADIQGGRQLQHRLAEMGLRTGSRFIVINNGHPGPFIINLKGTRLLLGRSMVHRIFVVAESDKTE